MKRSIRLALVLFLLFLVLFPLAVEGVPLTLLVDHFRTFVTIFLGIFIEAVPFLLAGTLASGLIETFVRREWVQNLSPRSPILGGVMGALMGLVFPVCECGVVPVTRRLVRKGLPLPAAIAYMLAAPVINPIVIVSTWTAFGWSAVLWMRMALTLVVAVVTGCVFALSRDPSRVLLSEQVVAPTCCNHGDEESPQTKESSKPSWIRRIAEALVLSGDEFFEMGRYLILGSLLAAGMQTLVPQAVLLGVGQVPAASVLVMMALAFVLSICSTVDAFVALTFTRTFTTGAILAFLVFGPMVDIKSLLMFLGVFRRRAVAYLVLLPLTMVLFAALSFNLLAGW
ncbi:MAG: permease [Anaerolineae bacterium]|nr:permease [Anaerolineae bacterium]